MPRFLPPESRPAEAGPSSIAACQRGNYVACPQRHGLPTGIQVAAIRPRQRFRHGSSSHEYNDSDRHAGRDHGQPQGCRAERGQGGKPRLDCLHRGNGAILISRNHSGTNDHQQWQGFCNGLPPGRKHAQLPQQRRSEAIEHQQSQQHRTANQCRDPVGIRLRLPKGAQSRRQVTRPLRIKTQQSG